MRLSVSLLPAAQEAIPTMQLATPPELQPPATTGGNSSADGCSCNSQLFMARWPHHMATYLHCWSTLGESSPGANSWPCFVAAGAKWFGEQRQATKLLIALEQGRQAWDVGPQDDVLVRIRKACKRRCRDASGLTAGWAQSSVFTANTAWVAVIANAATCRMPIELSTHTVC